MRLWGESRVGRGLCARCSGADLVFGVTTEKSTRLPVGKSE